MTYEYQTEFTYVADTDPLTGAPVMTAIPQTVRAAKQGIPYNVLSNFGDLFKRENLREAWRLLRKNDPFDYQIQVADAILYSCLNGLGWYFVVQITRQAGKNEISAFLQHYLLLYGWYFGVPVSGVKFAPVYKPQIQASMDRLEGAPTLDSGGLAGSVITSGQAKVDGQPCKYSKSDGYKFHIGPPRDSKKDCVTYDQDENGVIQTKVDDDKLMTKIVILAVDKDQRSNFTFANGALLKKLGVHTAEGALSTLLPPGEIVNFAVAVQNASGFGNKAKKKVKDSVKNS